MSRARALLAALLLLAGASCGPAGTGRIDADDYQAFWLWPGVAPQPALETARTLYLLDGELRAAPRPHYVALRPGLPRLPGKALWLVVRTDTLDWPLATFPDLVARLDRWAAAGNRIEGLQIDFDARAREIGGYARFLEGARRGLPRRYRLSITGLMDWSANGDPRTLATLGRSIDEVVIQTYQAHATIPGYEAYFEKMRGFPLPFKVGLVQGGEWREPAGLASERNFCGYVVFLLNPAPGPTADVGLRPASSLRS